MSAVADAGRPNRHAPAHIAGTRAAGHRTRAEHDPAGSRAPAGAGDAARARPSRSMTAVLDRPVIGYRLWLARDGALCALDGEPWAPGDVMARCRHTSEHRAPEIDCGCGLYVLHRRPREVPDGCVLGMVVAWGALAVHIDGLRAQHARPVALARTSSVAPAMLSDLAARYAISVVDLELLTVVGQEFGTTVPAEHQPIDHARLLTFVTYAICRHEQCRPPDAMLDLAHDVFARRVLARLLATPAPAALRPLLREAWDDDDEPDRDHWGSALARLREALAAELLCARQPRPDEVLARLRTLEAAHGDVRQAVASLAELHGADAIPDRYLFDSAIARELPTRARERARVMLSGAGALLPIEGDRALLVLEPDLTDAELERLLVRMRSSSHLGRLLEQTRRRGPQIAVAALKRSSGSGAQAAALQLGRGARPLLLRHLLRNPRTFSWRRVPIIDGMLGERALRLAAEHVAKRSSDAVDLLGALALLPGDEASPALHLLVRRVNGLRPGMNDDLRRRAWNALCGRDHLVSQLAAGVVRTALADHSLGTVNHVLLLRAHPDSDHARAVEIWRDDELLPRFALDVLRATGPAQRELADEALQMAHDAKRSSRAASRLSAAIALERWRPLGAERLIQIAGDQDQPATVRVVALWASRNQPVCDDPVARRYREWQRTRAQQTADPLIDLLSGAWHANTLL